MDSSNFRKYSQSMRTILKSDNSIESRYSIKGKLLVPDLVMYYSKNIQHDWIKYLKLRSCEQKCKFLKDMQITFLREWRNANYVKNKYRIIDRLISIDVLWESFHPNTSIKDKLCKLHSSFIYHCFLSSFLAILSCHPSLSSFLVILPYHPFLAIFSHHHLYVLFINQAIFRRSLI